MTPSTQLAVGSPITITANGELGVNFFFNGATTTQSVNFAFGGAGSGLGNASDPRLPGILREVQAFTDDLTLANKSADPNALYIVWAAGSNDYSSGNFTEPTIPIQNISQGVMSLFEAGARNILVPNIPDLGNVPRNLSLGPDISNALTQLSQAHNFSLATT
ncbi:MAG: phospholipase, partial [Tatlockia sp.]|nr:phospholipase [Tatlockia sp.]